jgi:hypothetical protein
MIAKHIIYFILLLALGASAKDAKDIKNNAYNIPKDLGGPLIIKLPWSDRSNIHEPYIEKLFFTTKLIKKEDKTYIKYKKILYDLKHNDQTDLSTYFISQNHSTKSNLEDDNYRDKINPLNIHLKRQKKFFNQMNYLKDKKKYDDNISRHLFKREFKIKMEGI